MNSIEIAFDFLREHWYLVVIPILITVFKFAFGEAKSEWENKKCEFCLSEIDLNARTCKHCGKDQISVGTNSIGQQRIEIANKTSDDYLRQTWGWQKNKLSLIIIVLILIALAYVFSID